jgi:putative ABC transport system permease protein
MGAVLVSQLMGAVLSQQIRQIGILKAIGASRIQVIGIYLAMVMILGAVSSMVAIPLAVLSGYGYAGFVAKTLNFEILTRSLPVSLYIYLIASGFILPVLLSLPAILKGVKVSVYEAITDHGISQNGASGIIKESLFLPFPNSMRLAFRNTLRRKKRLAITIVTMALGVAIFSTGFNVRQSLSVFLADSRDAMKHDVQLVFKDQIPLQKALAPFQTLGNLKRIESWNGGKGRLQTGIVSTSGGIGIIALPWNTDLMTWKILEGRWLKPSENIEMVMNQQAAEAFGNPTGTSHDSTSAKGIWPEVGRTYSIHIKGKEINATLVGIIKEFDIAKIYLDQKQYDLAVNPDHLINSLMFVAGDNTYKKVLDLKKDIENAIASSDLNILYVMSQAERAQIIYDHLNIILTILAFLALLVLVVSALGMASATSINIMERTREIGVLRAIGATPKMIYSLFVTEGMFVSIVSILLGLLLAWPMSIAASLFFGYLILGSNTPLDFAFSYSGFVITLLITFAFGWLASRIPARKAVKVSTREALSYE